MYLLTTSEFQNDVSTFLSSQRNRARPTARVYLKTLSVRARELERRRAQKGFASSLRQRAGRGSPGAGSRARTVPIYTYTGTAVQPKKEALVQSVPL